MSNNQQLQRAPLGWPRGRNVRLRELDYVEVTADVGSTSATEGATTVITSHEIVVDGRVPLWFEVYCPEFANSGDNAVVMSLWEVTNGVAAEVCRLCGISYVQNGATSGQGGTAVSCRRKYKPSAGKKTYQVRIHGANSTFNAGPGGNGQDFPGYLRILCEEGID